MYNRTINFFIACAGMLLFGITLITLGTTLPDLKTKFGLDEITAGALFAILPFGILAGSLVFGYICDRYGYKGLLSVSIFLVAVGLAGVAYLSSMTLLKICIFVLGFGGGCINGATNALVSDISHKHKGANLSLLGVFFAIGALGMPLILGILRNSIVFENVLYALSVIALLILVVTSFVKFPPAKNTSDIQSKPIFGLFRNEILLLIAFFLFFQSSLEAVVHNWITTYLNESLNIAKDKALYALTLNVAGMAVMRLLIGSVLRKVSDQNILMMSMLMLLAGGILLALVKSYTALVIVLVILGAGMAAGFPMMYAIVGRSQVEISATAFSFILSVALIGNMLINYLMGLIAKNYGIEKVVAVIIAEAIIMFVLCKMILEKDKRATAKINLFRK